MELEGSEKGNGTYRTCAAAAAAAAAAAEAADDAGDSGVGRSKRGRCDAGGVWNGTFQCTKLLLRTLDSNVLAVKTMHSPPFLFLRSEALLHFQFVHSAIRLSVEIFSRPPSRLL